MSRFSAIELFERYAQYNNTKFYLVGYLPKIPSSRNHMYCDSNCAICVNGPSRLQKCAMNDDEYEELKEYYPEYFI